MSKQRLSVSETHEYVHLYNILEKYRTLVVDYILLRSSSSNDQSEKRAWQILVALLVFVETRHHFPYKEELDNYLRKFLDNRSLDLPPLTQLDLLQLRELTKSLETSLEVYDQEK